MAKVTIIGTGNMGTAIAGLVTKGGNDLEVISSEDTDKQVTGDIVILAVPFSAASDVLKTRGASFAGKVVVDITNPVNMETFDSLVVPSDSSATAEFASAVPEARWVKAFNTNFAGTLASGKVAELGTTVLIAGDDAAAKRQLADAVNSGGLKTVDVGSLNRARELEALGFLQILLAASGNVSWTGGFGVVA